MREGLHFLLYVFGFVLFVIGTFNVPARLNLQSAGLACWIATLIW